MNNLVIQHLSAHHARQIQETIAEVHARGYADAIATGNPFESTEAFMERFENYSAIAGFTFVLAFLGDQPVGQAFGWPLSADSAWWRGLSLTSGQPPLEEFTRENGKRTFAFSELMVDKAHTGRGIASALFRDLMSDRPEQRATWLVNPTNPAYAIYRHWGSHTVGTLQPEWEGAPLFDVLILDLPL